RVRQLTASEFNLTLNGQGRRLQLHLVGDHGLEVCLDNRRWPVSRHARFEAAVDSSASDGRLLAPMPGKILEIRAKAGQTVAAGDTLMIMEAMKMELTIKAPINGEIAAMAVAAEDIVEADTLLLAIDPATDS